MGQTKTVTMKIDTEEHLTLKLRQYRAQLHKRELVEQAVQEILDAGIIERSQSPWSFPIVIVRKKNGGYRLYVDFRTLNKISKPTACPLPLIDNILALLVKVTCFSTIKLRAGY